MLALGSQAGRAPGDRGQTSPTIRCLHGSLPPILHVTDWETKARRSHRTSPLGPPPPAGRSPLAHRTGWRERHSAGCGEAG